MSLFTVTVGPLSRRVLPLVPAGFVVEQVLPRPNRLVIATRVRASSKRGEIGCFQWTEKRRQTPSGSDWCPRQRGDRVEPAGEWDILGQTTRMAV